MEAAEGRMAHNNGWNRANGMASMGSRVALWSKALSLSSRSITTDPGLILGLIGSPIGRRTIVPASSSLGFGRGRPSL